MKLQVTALFILLILSLAFCVILFGNQPEISAAADFGTAEPTQALPPETSEPTLPPETTLPPEPTLPEVTWMTFPSDRALKAQQYFVYDFDREVFQQSSGMGSEKVYPASITKLFTAYMATQHLEPEQELTVGDVLDRLDVDSSVAQLQKGDVLTVDRAVEAMLLPSGNDAAYVLAEAMGRHFLDDPQASTDAALDAYMEKMNQTAQELGMTGTHFVNPDGIHDDNHYTTFDDLVILGQLSLENPAVLKYTQTSLETIALNSGEKTWHNTNALIDPDSPYYCPYAIGLKTGQTSSAGSCLLSAFQIDGRTLLVGVFGCPEPQIRFEDSLQLFNQAIGVR